MNAALPVGLLSALILALATLTPSATLAQEPASAGLVTTTHVSHFDAPRPLPSGPLDHILQVVNLDPGAATPFHSHLGPGFATILQGQVVHHRFALDRDTRYGPGDTWVEIPHDVHFARDDALIPATILATFILPGEAAPSNPTDEQPTPAAPSPTVPVLVRIPVTTAAPGYAVTQLMRTYSPGGSTTSVLDAGAQAIVIVVEGELTTEMGENLRTYATGDFWVETSETAVTTWNATTSIATTVVSILTAHPNAQRPSGPSGMRRGHGIASI